MAGEHTAAEVRRYRAELLAEINALRPGIDADLVQLAWWLEDFQQEIPDSLEQVEHHHTVNNVASAWLRRRGMPKKTLATPQPGPATGASNDSGVQSSPTGGPGSKKLAAISGIETARNKTGRYEAALAEITDRDVLVTLRTVPLERATTAQLRRALAVLSATMADMASAKAPSLPMPGAAGNAAAPGGKQLSTNCAKGASAGIATEQQISRPGCTIRRK